MVIDTTICEELIEVAILGAGHGILTEALGICKDLQELRPNASMYSFSECYCYYLCDKYQEAAEIYETKFKPHFPEYDFGEAILCSCWWMTDNITKAKNIFNQLEQKERMPDPALVSQFEGIFDTAPPMHAVSTQQTTAAESSTRVVSEKWVEGLQEVNDRAISLSESVEMLSSGAELGAHDLIKLQMQVHKVAMASELSAKSAGKMSDGTKTLLQNQL